jgi:hypothetical protein
VAALSKDGQTSKVAIAYRVADPVALTYRGSMKESITGTISAGNLKIKTAPNGTPQSVNGQLTLGATDGSTATVKVTIAKVSGWYIGAIKVPTETTA